MANQRSTKPDDADDPSAAGAVPPAREVLGRVAKAYLDIADATGVVSRVALDGRNVLIGRAADVEIRLDRLTVSRHHAEILCDPFGRWWVRDLRARNGVLFGGQRVTERALRPGDAFQIGEFLLTFTQPLALYGPQDEPADDADWAAGARSISVFDTGPAGITSARDLETPKISASHLSMLLNTGRELLEIESAEDRLSLLCRLMVRDEFNGTAAMAIRVVGDNVDAPLRLCAPQTGRHGSGAQPHASRNLLRAVRNSGQPAMASNLAQPGMTAYDMGLRAGDSTGARGHQQQMVELSMAVPIGGTGLSCAVACPLRTDGGSVDLLYVTFPPAYATGEWLSVAALATELYRLAESAWAGRRLALEHAAVERELEKARQIQTQLVPRDLKFPGLESVIGFHPCRWVGGDYVDAALAPDGRVLLAVADVCGKGLAAALVASSLHTLVHASLRRGAGLAEMMEGVNEHLCGYLSDSSFATMAVVLIDAATGELECVNAGHPPPLVIGGSGPPRQLQSGANFPLGISLDPMLVQSDRIAPDEMLALYTDGLTETRIDDGSLMGIQQLGRELTTLYTVSGGVSIKGVSQDLMKLLDKTLGSRLPDDDRAYVLARRS